MTRKSVGYVLLVISLLTILSGCVGQQPPATPISTLPLPPEHTETTTPPVSEKTEHPDNLSVVDTEIGLKNTKIDTSAIVLSDEQKRILQYFDNDYFTIPYDGYEFIRRYPKIYQGAQLQLDGIISKVVSQKADTYEAVLWVGMDSLSLYDIKSGSWVYYSDYYTEKFDDLALIRGNTSDSLFLEDDYIDVYGRYSGVETVTIDGTAYTVPVIDVYDAFIHDSGYHVVQKFDAAYIKDVAKIIFGENIEVRSPVVGDDFVDGAQEALGWHPFYIVELENQSNAKFTKYRFFSNEGKIEDAKEPYGTDSQIDRRLEFSADFQHFFLFTYDHGLETLTLEYYDTKFNKLWKREFEATTGATYDYTKNGLYLVANNELYIINLASGENKYEPFYVGSRLDVRKLADGLLMVAPQKSDAIVKTDLKGKVMWKANVDSSIVDVNGIQFIDENIVLDLNLEDGPHYIVLDAQSGSMIQDASIATQQW